MKHRAIAMIVAIVAFAATASSATATMIHHEHHRVTFELDNTICDNIDAHSVWSVVENDAIRLSSSGFPMESGVGRGTVTFTDKATGASVSFVFAGGGRDFSAIDNGDGTFTRDSQQTGKESMIVSGRTVDTWSGRIVFRDIVDYNGTPAIGDDDTVLQESIVFMTGGPHSELLDGCAILNQ